MNSIGTESPCCREAVTLVAGKALGRTWIELRRLLLLMTSDAIDTADRRHRVSALCSHGLAQVGVGAHIESDL